MQTHSGAGLFSCDQTEQLAEARPGFPGGGWHLSHICASAAQMPMVWAQILCCYLPSRHHACKQDLPPFLSLSHSIWDQVLLTHSICASRAGLPPLGGSLPPSAQVPLALAASLRPSLFSSVTPWGQPSCRVWVYGSGLGQHSLPTSPPVLAPPVPPNGLKTRL